MKTLLLILLFSLHANAGKISEVMILTEESIQQTLNLEFENFQILKMDFISSQNSNDITVKTTIIVNNVSPNTKDQWTCVTQFVKTPEFIKVSKTECH